jgi:hypothetical protein
MVGAADGDLLAVRVIAVRHFMIDARAHEAMSARMS